MAEAMRPPTNPGTSIEWSPARIYLVASGLFLVIISAVGFAYNSAFPTSSHDVHAAGSAHIFGVLMTNGWHNVAGLGGGVLALALAVRPEWARFGALLTGAIYVVLTTAIVVWGGDTFLIATNNADQVVHASLAIGGIATGLLTQPSSTHKEV